MTLRRAALAVSTAALVTLSACGSSAHDLSSDTSSSDSVSPSTSSPSATPSGTTSSPTPSGTSSPSPSGGASVASDALSQDDFVATVTAAQLQARTVHMALSTQTSGQTLSMDGDVSAGQSLQDSSADFTMSLPGAVGGLHMILVDGQMYLNLGQLSGGKFVKVDLSDPSNPLSSVLGGLQSQFDPSSATKALAGAITSFKNLGPETVNGEQTTKYAVTVDAKKALGGLGSLGQLGSTMPSTLSYMFWVNSDKLPVKLSLQGGSAIRVTMVFTHWGEPVQISPPPASQITKNNPLSGSL